MTTVDDVHRSFVYAPRDELRPDFPPPKIFGRETFALVTDYVAAAPRRFTPPATNCPHCAELGRGPGLISTVESYWSSHFQVWQCEACIAALVAPEPRSCPACEARFPLASGAARPLPAVSEFYSAQTRRVIEFSTKEGSFQTLCPQCAELYLTDCTYVISQYERLYESRRLWERVFEALKIGAIVIGVLSLIAGVAMGVQWLLRR